MTEYIPSPRQFIAHTCQADELLYGGAAGGGKSEFLRQEALRTLTEFPGANVVYFRRRNSELEESVSRSRALCSPYGGRYTGGHLMQWKFPELVDPTTGRVSTWKFSHMNQEDDKYRHQSNEFDLIVFDEGSTFTRSMISFMRSRNRTPIPRSPARIRIGTNPGGISHVYFKDRFQIPDYEGAPREERTDLVSEVLYYWPIEESEALWNEITRYYDMRDRDQQDAAKVEWLKRRDEQGIFWRPYPDSIRYSKKTIDPYDIWRPMPESEDDRMPRTRCFIPAKIDDNPIYATDDSYRSSLATLGDETYVRALLHGDWSVFEGQFFKDWDQNIHVIDPIIPPGHWPTWGSMDWGMSDWGVFQWHTQDPDTEQIITYREYKFREKDIRSVARDIVGMTTDQETLLKVLADPAMFKRQGSTEVEAMIPKACREEGLILEPADNTRITGWATCRSLLAKNPSTGLPYWVATSNCSYLINTIPYLVHHENNVEDIARHGDDHACFVPWTQITTDQGEKRIDDIRPGDMVLTREGYRPVVESGVSALDADVYSLFLSNGRQITGTGNHPIWIQDTGWTRLDAVRYGDILLSCETKLLSSTESNTVATRNQRTGLIESISLRALQIANVVSGGSIRRSGSLITGRFLKAITSTILMAPPSTMTSPTSSAFHTMNTSRNTQSPEDHRNIWHVFRNWRKSGTVRLKDGHGTANMPSVTSHSAPLFPSPVSNVVLHTRITPSGDQAASVPTNAKPNGDETRRSTMRSALARFVGRALRQTNTTKPELVPVHVVSVYAHYQTEAVYNLTVAETPEYFADGVLVHNCDAWRYGMSKRPSLGGAVRRTRVRPGRIRSGFMTRVG